MRVSSKLVIGLVVASAAVLGGHGYFQLREEERDLRRAAEHDLHLLGATVKVAVENSLRDGQTADIREILDSMDRRDPAVDVLVFDARGDLVAASPGTDGAAAIVRAATETSPYDLPLVRFEGLERLVAIFPLHDDARRPLGTLGIVQPLAELRRDLAATQRATILSSATLILAVSAVSWVLVLLYVRRPLGRLAAAMRAVRAGDLSACVAPARADELGAMAAEFNLMVGELEDARQRLLDAARAREVLELGLQRLDKLATLGQLSAGLAHEIGSPLQILNGRARQLARRLDLPADVQRTASILEEQSDRIAKIVERFLGCTRREAAHLGQVDLGAAVAAIVELFEPEARRCGVMLSFERPAALPAVIADRDQVQQVVMNLLGNALQATARGGQIRLSLQPSSLTAGGRVSQIDAVAMVVEDTGTGMSEEVRQHMFEPFFTTGAGAGRTGLGLAVVKSIVDEHGGAIAVRSQRGVGTTVTVQLPVTGARAGGVLVA